MRELFVADRSGTARELRRWTTALNPSITDRRCVDVQVGVLGHVRLGAARLGQDLLEVLVGDAQHDRAEHLDESAVGVEHEVLVARSTPDHASRRRRR